MADIPGLGSSLSSFHFQDSEYQGYVQEVVNLRHGGDPLYQAAGDWEHNICAAGSPCHLNQIYVISLSVS